MGAEIQIVEVGPRDGLQNESRLLSTEQKITYAELGFAAGINRVELTSFVHPKAVPQMADAEKVVAGVVKRSGRSGLVLNQRGLIRALATELDEINFVVLASEEFSQRNQKMSVAESVLETQIMLEQAKAAAKKTTVTIATAFGCPFQGEVPETAVFKIYEALNPDLIDEVAIADTVGVGVPRQVKSLLTGLGTLAPVGTGLRCHFHNTRNTGFANAYAAVAAGATALDAAIGGIGGCPFAPRATGNIATEDLAYLLAREGVSTGIDLAKIVAAAEWLQQALGGEIPGQLSKAGIWPN